MKAQANWLSDSEPLVRGVLIVDDDEGVREAVAEVVVDAGLRALHARSAEGALKVLELGAVDVIITDLNLPGKSGLLFLSDARFAGYCQPCIILTGFGTKENAIEALRLGATDFLEKPFEAEALRDLLRHTANLGLNAVAPGAVAELKRLVDELAESPPAPLRHRVLTLLSERFDAIAAKAPSPPEPPHAAAAIGARAARLLLQSFKTPTKDMTRVMNLVVNLLENSLNPQTPELSADLRRFDATLTELERRFRLAG